tara:strand:- start:8838 stop:10589 length:1752 start_codon:yes stop_codon:yes gene_type:complete
VRPFSVNKYSKSYSSYSDILKDIENGNITSIILYLRRSQIKVSYSNGDESIIPVFYNDQLILEKAINSKTQLIVHDTKSEIANAKAFTSTSLLIIFLFAIIFIVKSTSKLANRAFRIGKTNTRFIEEDDVETRFDDVAGVPEAAEELKELIAFLKNPKKLIDLGAKIPKGVLLIGPPGTGKTLLARAIAGESGVPFITISASEFVEMFVGVGASRVRDLFNKAKEKSPCILFIDEIDSIGRQRGSGIGGGNDEREQTLNQLLTEMDGFLENSGVIVLAATNRADVLDSALLRPGRFDRKIEVALPDKKGRLDILSVHSLSKPLSQNIDLKSWANRTPGFSGADLKNLLNESAILCARDGAKTISNMHINEALDKLTIGISSGKILNDEKLKLIAYHEVGHAIVAAVNEGIDIIDKITILSRGIDTGGYTRFLPKEDSFNDVLISKRSLLSRLQILLAGRAAEIVVYGFSEITQGAVQDIDQVTLIAREMVTKYGFSSLANFSLEDDSKEIYLGRDLFDKKVNYSQITSSLIDQQIIKLAKASLEYSINILSSKRILLDLLADKLIEHETIDNDIFSSIYSEYN